jgi:PhnB protein
MNYLTSRITPYLLYEDLPGAVDWLSKAFGFRLRYAMPEGKITHAEMQLGEDGLIMVGYPGPQYRNPKHTGIVTQNLYVRVENVDEHFGRAVQAGAVVLEEPTDQPYGDRRYAVEDPEGHHWYFGEAISHKIVSRGHGCS